MLGTPLLPSLPLPLDHPFKLTKTASCLIVVYEAQENDHIFETRVMNEVLLKLYGDSLVGIQVLC